jgi:regulator of sigma D
VSPESLEPILASFKRIEHYEFAEAMDPQERENIVDLVAAFHFHISTRNAHELGMMMHGLETLSKAEQVHPELVAEALIKKAKMRNINLNTAETKELVANPKEVAQQLLELVQPKAKITKEDLGNVS